MPYVLDASIATCWAFADESDPVASWARALLVSDTASAPSLWWFEVRNALIVNERRNRISEPETMIFLGRLGRMPIAIDQSPLEADLLSLARLHKLTVYDAAYLELARRRGEPLATLDRKLALAAAAESISLLGTP
jgi:predicted nucleic acid-binding protein